MWHILLAFPLGAIAALQTGTCDYTKVNGYNGETYCIAPKETASVEFDFPPLFPKGAKFVYAADEVTGEELAAMEPLLDEDKVKDNESTMTGWWLEYDEVSLNNTDLYMVTDMIVAYTNTTNKIEGNHNGCEGLLGKECIDSINSTVRAMWANQGTPLQYLFQNITQSSLDTSCPSDLFISFQSLEKRINTINRVGEMVAFLLAAEAPINITIDEGHQHDDVMPSSNSSLTYSRTVYMDRPIEFQERKAAVAMLLRYPPYNSWTNKKVRNTTADDATLALVCTKLSESDSDSGSGSDSDSQDSSSDDKDDAAASVGVPTGVLSVAMLTVLLWLNY